MSFLFKLLRTTKFFATARMRNPNGFAKKLPKVIQLPITYNCNSKCVMCNIWKMDYSNELSLEEFAHVMKDPLFSKVEFVGINGGEPSLVKQLPAYAEEILKLPSLKGLNIISHGFNQKQLLPFLKEIYKLCKQYKKTFHIAISLDGYGETHNVVRGLNVFKIVSDTILQIKNNQHEFCDSYDVGCTVVKQNIHQLIELDQFAQLNNINIKYRLGIENKRIESDKLVDQYSLLKSDTKQAATEFFHSRINAAKNWMDKFKYFSIYHFLAFPEQGRLLGCHWQEDGVTMDSRGDIYYCAVASEKIGSIRNHEGTSQFFSEKNLAYRQKILDDSCNNCIHDYNGKPNMKSLIKFFKFLIHEKTYSYVYKLKTFF